MLIIHGHELDTVVQNVKWLAFAGDVGYQFLLSLNPFINFVRRRFDLGYWSLSAYAKKRVKDGSVSSADSKRRLFVTRKNSQLMLFFAVTSTAQRSGNWATLLITTVVIGWKAVLR